VLITGKRVRSIKRFVRHLDRKKELFVYSLVKNTGTDFAAVGFPSAPKMGDTILPAEIGPVSRFNSEGKIEPDKTKPKERRVVGQRIWRWVEFRGRYDRVERERTIDIERECYPRKVAPPPSVEMSVLDVAGKLRLVSSVGTSASDEELTHAVNLYLEFFGECHVTDDPASVPIVSPKRVNWRLLPPGANPWARARTAVTGRIKSRSADDQSIIVDRQEFVCSLDPDEVYVGEGGFSDYLAYVFTSKNKVVLESLTSGNAIYVFDKNWRAFSHLTKREILAQNLHKHRIIHATGWKPELKRVLQ
jgi:hypothetical protein